MHYFAIAAQFQPIYKNMRLGKCLKNALRRFLSESWGPTATEYAVLLVLVVFGCLTAISLLGAFLKSSVQSTAQALPSGASSSPAAAPAPAPDPGNAKKGQPATPPKSKAPPQRRKSGGSVNLEGFREPKHLYVLAKTANLKVSHSQQYIRQV